MSKKSVEIYNSQSSSLPAQGNSNFILGTSIGIRPGLSIKLEGVLSSGYLLAAKTNLWSCKIFKQFQFLRPR